MADLYNRLDVWNYMQIHILAWRRSKFVIAELCFAQAVKFIEHNASEIDSDTRAQVIVLQYLLFRFMNNGTRGYIVTRELRDQLRNTKLRSISDTAFRMRIIGRLRDKGVLSQAHLRDTKFPLKDRNYTILSTMMQK